MHLFVNAVVGVEDGRKVWVRGVARGLLGIPPLTIYVCWVFSRLDELKGDGALPRIASAVLKTNRLGVYRTTVPEHAINDWPGRVS